MDPNAPRKAPDPQDIERLQRTQRRVVAALIVTTVLHLAVGFVIAADHVDEDRLDARIGLSLIASAFMVGGIVATLLVLRRSWRSPWLLLGLLPAAVGIAWTML